MSIIIAFTALLVITATQAQSCSGNGWSVNYNGNECSLSGGEYTISCPDKNNLQSCGSRLDNSARIGAGHYTAQIRAAPGDGTDTDWYLFTYGQNNDKNKPWNEIDIEILGNQINGGTTKLWTNVWSGQGTQHGEYVTLNFDASAAYHTYEIQVEPSPSATIYWIIDGQVKRYFYYGGYSDIVSTVNNKNFQMELSLWGGDGSWSGMGALSGNTNKFPIHAYWKNLQVRPSDFDRYNNTRQ
eukprot:UN10928